MVPFTFYSAALRARLLPVPILWGAALAWATPAAGLDLKVNYTHDLAAENFFNTYPAAKAALEQAALDVGNLISVAPTEISAEYFPGAAGPAEVNFDLDLRYRNPSTGVMRQVDAPFVAAGEVIIFVGSQALPENKLAYSEISTVKNTISWNGAGTAAEMQTATGIAAADAEAVWRRGAGGPVFNSLTGPVSLGGATLNFQADMGPIAASIWFDTDTNNNGDADTGTQLAAYWHFDHTTLPPANKFDFYSTALHELLHGIGLGTARSHDLLLGSTSGGETTWLGPAARALNGGSAFDLADADTEHIREGLMSPRLSDGVLQEALMDPTIGVGQRKSITQMDAAFLQDLGWTLTTPIPEPGVLVWLGLALGLRRRRAGG
jgi:hypothetical protein